jgi:hypothetical protein
VRVGDRLLPKEQTHAQMAVEWVQRLDPNADEAQLIAACAHHLRRWVVPRSSYPEGRAGYLRWRRDQKVRHAQEVAEILREVGYDDVVVERVQQIIRKEGLGRDPDVQVHEDALCLVFLETQLSEVAQQLGHDKAVAVIAKTAAKMSDGALAAARALPYDDETAALLEQALAPS